MMLDYIRGTLLLNIIARGTLLLIMIDYIEINYC